MIDFQALSPSHAPQLWQHIANLPLPNIDLSQHKPPRLIDTNTNIDIDTNPNTEFHEPSNLHGYHQTNQQTSHQDKHQNKQQSHEKRRTDWLITLFNDLFVEQNVTLVHACEVGRCEPEYLPAVDTDSKTEPAKICFAHGFFASALHEISHWTIAGKHRRQLNDFGYWYAPDGRSEQQQQHFEQVEIKPQAIECLLTLVCGEFCGYPFRVSQDNLFAEFDTSDSTFATDVFALASDFLRQPNRLPKDAQTLLVVLWRLCYVKP